MRDDFICNVLETELHRQSELLGKAQQSLATAPAGYLYVRDTGKHYSCYHVTKNGDNKVHKKISGNTRMIRRLLTKTKCKSIKRICSNNVKILRRAQRDYMPLSNESLLPPKHRKIQNQISADNQNHFVKAPFNPKAHIHETASGELVRSKSEVIIANALWHFGIPFNYEERFPYPDDDGTFYYPDFTIHCPDGTKIIWEHWGLLSKRDYCAHNSGKLYTYNQHGHVIGKDLIITQDDISGNCSTELIYHIIEEYILPHFR